MYQEFFQILMNIRGWIFLYRSDDIMEKKSKHFLQEMFNKSYSGIHYDQFFDVNLCIEHLSS